jgi:hypothetical protein
MKKTRSKKSRDTVPLNLLITEHTGDLGHFTLQYEQDYVLSGPRQSSIMFASSGFNSVYSIKFFTFHFNEFYTECFIHAKLYTIATVNADLDFSSYCIAMLSLPKCTF